jgi:hypothetical protein
VRQVTFRPASRDGAPIRLIVGEAWVVAVLGEASRFELGVSETDRHFLAELLEATVGGGLREVTDMFGTAYTVRYPDGTVRRGRVVQIGWRGRSSRDYGPWRIGG